MTLRLHRCGFALLGMLLVTTVLDYAQAQTARVRARDLGIAIGTMTPGPLNAITDVASVIVGHSTVVRGSGALRVGEGPVRTGVTAVLPRKDIWFNAVFGATHTLNGDGEMTGIHWIRDLRRLRTRS